MQPRKHEQRLHPIENEESRWQRRIQSHESADRAEREAADGNCLRQADQLGHARGTQRQIARAKDEEAEEPHTDQPRQGVRQNSPRPVSSIDLGKKGSRKDVGEGRQDCLYTQHGDRTSGTPSMAEHAMWPSDLFALSGFIYLLWELIRRCSEGGRQ